MANSEATPFKERHPAASKTDIRHLHHLGIIRQQSDHRKKARFRNDDNPERQEDPKDAEGEDQGKSGYITAGAWPGGRFIRPNSEKVPVEYEQYEQRLKKKVNSIFSTNRGMAVVIDDETYLTLDGNNWQGTSYFTSPTKEVGSEVKFISHTKFPKKVLLWLTISEKGMSKPLFLCSGLAVNGEIYSTKCQPEVASFIKKYDKGEDVVFWPDLALAHYSKRSLEEMDRLNIDVVPKSVTPLNVSQLRPIENFWANLKLKIYSNNFSRKLRRN